MLLAYKITRIWTLRVLWSEVTDNRLPLFLLHIYPIPLDLMKLVRLKMATFYTESGIVYFAQNSSLR